MAGFTGLWMKSAAPQSKPRVSSSGWFSAVRKITGVPCVRSSAFSRRQVS